MKLFSQIKKNRIFLRFSKSRTYARFRQHFPQSSSDLYEDPSLLDWKGAQTIRMEWPVDIKKPRVGLVRDTGQHPRWSKYALFFEKNEIPFEFFDIHKSDWLEKANRYDAIIGVYSNDPSCLDEFRRKYFFLEEVLGKVCYPGSFHLQLYEDKRFEAEYCKLFNFPFARTFITHDKDEALKYIETVMFPIVSKLDPSSGSMTVELIRSRKSCLKVIHDVFSPQGRKTHFLYWRQKDYVYFQEFIPNDGFDIRVIIAGSHAYGYRRCIPGGDFRASGMNLIVDGHLPPEAISIARRLYNCLKSPMLAVDFVHGKDDRYYIIEYSPLAKIDTPSELIIDGERYAYILNTGDTYHQEKELVWIHDLVLQEFFNQKFLHKDALLESDTSNMSDEPAS